MNSDYWFWSVHLWFAPPHSWIQLEFPTKCDWHPFKMITDELSAENLNPLMLAVILSSVRLENNDKAAIKIFEICVPCKKIPVINYLQWRDDFATAVPPALPLETWFERIIDQWHDLLGPLIISHPLWKLSRVFTYFHGWLASECCSGQLGCSPNQ